MTRNTECSAPARLILLALQTQKGKGEGKGEKNAKGKREYQEGHIYSSSKVPANYHHQWLLNDILH